MELKLLKQNLNYDKIVRGKDLDFKTYNKKFEMWDYVEKNNLLAKKDPRVLKLLDDPTIYAYAFFKLDGSPLKFTAYQDAIAGCKHDFTANNPDRFVLFKASNQIGKSYFLAADAICKVQEEDNINVVIVSKSLPQSQYVLATIRHILNNSDFGETWREDLGETANTTILSFERDNGKIVNRIICAPCGEGLLGYPVHYLRLDEGDFYENAKTFFWKVAYPRVAKTKGQIILFSNPNAEIDRNSSILWELWNGDLFKRKFTFNFLDAPWNTKKEYEIAKKNSPGYIFASTHDGVFPPDSGGFFTLKEVDDMMQSDWENRLPAVDRPVFIGMDLAKMKDRTVLSLGILRENEDDEKISDLEIKYFECFPIKTDYDKIINRLKHIIKVYKEQYKGVASIGMDVSGVGRAVSDFAKASGIKVTDVKFSLENKSRMYGNFKMLAEQKSGKYRRIKIVGNDDCKNQLLGLTFKRTPSGYLSVHHAKETIHDDYPDSICALIDVSIIPSKVPVTVTMVGRRETTATEAVVDTRAEVERRTIQRNMPSAYGSDFDDFRRMEMQF